MINEGKLLTAVLAAMLLTSCAHDPSVQPPPSLDFPKVDARLLEHCPSTYSTLPATPQWEDVQAAHSADIQQAEACRLKDDQLIGVFDKIQQVINAAQPPQPASQPVAQKPK